MKRVISILLSFVLTALCFTSCGKSGETGATASSGGSASAKAETTAGTDSGTKDEETVQKWDPDMEHMVIMDDSATKILIADLGKGGAEMPEDIVIEDCIVWEWDTNTAYGSRIQGQNVTMDQASIRYSSYWERDVVIFCGSGGWVGAVDYQTKEVLFEDNPGYGPHSVELLPNGDLVLACSGNTNSSTGRVLYYPLSKGSTKPASTVIPLESAHGVCYDPQNDIVWVLGGTEIIGCTASDGKLVKIAGAGCALGESGGHDFVPVYGQPGKYWVSTGKRILQFDANEQTVTFQYNRAKDYTGTSVKGIAWFPDGTMIQTAHDQGGTGTYRSSEFRILYVDYSSGKVKNLEVKEAVVPHREGSQTYKIHVFSKDYQ